MIKTKEYITKYTLSPEEAFIFKSALEYIRHRQEKHDKAKHLSKESVLKVLGEFYETN